jgi:exo-beta-1,3-glucanase (GH17 family)
MRTILCGAALGVVVVLSGGCSSTDATTKDRSGTTAGAAGTTGAGGGSAGTTGAGGTAGAAGTPGAGGSVGTAGTTGAGGSVGTAGTTGAGGSGGTAGTTGAGGTAGAAGTPGAGGAAGTAGSTGAGGSADAGSSGPRYFKTVCYEGYRDGQSPGGLEPTCDQVQQDLNMLAPFTHGIRTYGSNSAMHDGKCIPAIADAMGLDMHMGVWIDDTYGDATNFAAIDDSIVTLCGPAAGAAGCPNGASVHKSIKSVLVGNEYLLRVQEAKGNLVTAEQHLVSYIKYARARVPKNIEVVTSESYPVWLTASAALYQAVDRIVWQSHPYWESQPIASAAAYFASTHDKVVAKMKQYGINKPERCGETGWPWGSTNGAAVGSEANQAQYFKDLNAYAFSVSLEVWIFEAFDENWKASAAHAGSSEGLVGGQWGFWKADRSTPHQVVSVVSSLVPPNQMWP